MSEPERSFASRALIAVVIAAAVGGALYGAVVLAHVLMIVFAAVLGALFMTGLSGWVGRWTGLPHWASLALVIAALCVIGLLAWVFMAPRIASQVNQLADTLPEAVEQLENRIDDYQWGERALSRIDELERAPLGEATVRRARRIVSTGFGVLSDLALVLAVGFFLAAQPRVYVHGIVGLMPPSRRDQTRDVLGAVAHTLRRWLVGRFSSMTVVGVLTAVGLWILGIPLALTFGLLAGLLSFVPYLGPLLSVAPPALIAMTISPAHSLYVLALYAGVQAVETWLITPLIDRKAVWLPPALTIVTQVVMGVLFGAIGLILATPLVAFGAALVGKLYKEAYLGESAPF